MRDLEERLNNAYDMIESVVRSVQDLALRNSRVADQGVETLLDVVELGGRMDTVVRQVEEEVRARPPDRMIRMMMEESGIVPSSLVLLPSSR
jgi:hypothetical protein